MKRNFSLLIATYTALQAGVALKLEEDTYRRLSANDAFEAVEHDRMVELPPFKVEAVYPADGKNSQQTTCAVNRAGGSVNSSTSDRWLWIIDSGIDLNHPDLNVITNGTYARSFVGGNADDCNGHGTHVTDMSLGGYYGGNCANGSPYRNPVRSLGNFGNRVCIAAGNSRANSASYSPACVNGTRVYTVASMTCNYGFSSFSNYNVNPVDYIATGTDVYSTYKNGGYATISGTSMATPVVAGICHARNNAPRSTRDVRHRNENYRVARR